MDWLSTLGVIFSILGLIAGLLQIFSSERILKIIDSSLTSLRKLLPSIPAASLRLFVILSMFVILLVSMVVFITFTLSSYSGKNPSTIAPAQYATYQSNADTPGFTTHITWDIAPVVQHSLSIALNMRQSSNTKAVTQLSQKFGRTYTFFIIAQLDADSSTFTTTPKEQMQEQIGQGDLSFHWIATPLRTGDQAVDITVMGIWMPQDTSTLRRKFARSLNC